MSNRIFTPKVEAPNMNPATVNPEMDENGFIERINATNGMFVYGEENIVVYREERIDATGRRKTVRIPPQRLHVGDIVDVAFSMVVFGRGSELKARLLLRNITLLDATHTQKWLKEKVKAQSLNIRMQPTLKRRLEFEDAEEDARKRMKAMDIENDENEIEGGEEDARMRMKGMDIENDENEIEGGEEDARMRMKGMDIENEENGNEREGTCE
ncbi:hypothetical protein GG344DRAFT_81388 [Lentinula edodes]|nr:hypothetical protein GG344DRAFT_81388 [Lentinula edodes]